MSEWGIIDIEILQPLFSDKVMEQVYRYPLFLVTVFSSVLSSMYDDLFDLFIS